MSQEKIRQLLFDYFHDNISQDDKERLESYLLNHDLSDEVFLDAMDELVESSSVSEQFNKEKVINGIKSQINSSSKELKETSNNLALRQLARPFWKRPILIAASLCIFLIAGFLTYTSYIKYPDVNADNTPVWRSIETLRGQFTTINLPDGSSIRLNVSSKIKFKEQFLTFPTRRVQLDGEAYFKVASMPDKPFIIEANGVETEVVGTSFNISAYPNQSNVYVAVVEGKVKVESIEGGGQFYLLPDQMATCETNNIHISDFDRELVLGWADQTLVFKNASFEEVIDRLESWYNVDFVIQGTIKSKDYTANHKAEPLETILKGLSFAGNFSYTINGKEIIIQTNK